MSFHIEINVPETNYCFDTKKVIPILCAESVQILDQLFRLSVALIFHRICFQHFEKSEVVEHEIAQRRKYIKTGLFQFLFAASH